MALSMRSSITTSLARARSCRPPTDSCKRRMASPCDSSTEFVQGQTYDNGMVAQESGSTVFDGLVFTFEAVPPSI